MIVGGSNSFYNKVVKLILWIIGLILNTNLFRSWILYYFTEMIRLYYSWSKQQEKVITTHNYEHDVSKTILPFGNYKQFINADMQFDQQMTEY